DSPKSGFGTPPAGTVGDPTGERRTGAGAGASPSADLDAADPLARYRDLFVRDEDVVAYLDGNSLGRPTRASVTRLAEFAEKQWGGRLIRGWDEAWYELPLTVGDDLARITLGAAPGQTFIGDSTT